ncbi:hypothetical protein ACJ3XI_07500 [Litorimonas sp. RW-G-Af-16]|uniref:hypothetical protein n=1 Tax=Litorimonas sp. RW-G-Af-16 TaxID=3241168 RepID=UPI00390CD799
MRHIVTLSLLSAVAIAGCGSTPEPVAPEVIIAAPVQTCAPVSALQKVVIPAETKIQYAITQIENPPYAPIESKVKQVRVVKPAEVIYVDSEGRQALDICERDQIEIGPIGPGAGELVPDVEG